MGIDLQRLSNSCTAVLALMLCIAHISCNKRQQTKSPPAKAATQTEQQEPVSIRNEAAPDEEPPDVIVADVELSPTALGTTPLPGIPSTQMEKQLEDETSRVDPKRDGWDSEAFNEQALKQLKQIGVWLEAQETDFPSDVFASDFLATTLSPECQVVLSDDDFKVDRFASSDTSLELARTAEEFKTELRKLLPANEQYQAEFKIIGLEILPDKEQVQARVRCHFAAADSNSRYQSNAIWMTAWKQEPSEFPRLVSLTLEELETVTARNGTALFSEKSASILSGNDCYEQQIVFPLDYWRDRVDWRFGWEVVGAHGVAIGDVNGDGLDDVYFCDTGGLPNRLFVQQEDGTAKDIAAEAELDLIEPTHAALFVDLDNDGDQDLVASIAKYVFAYENLGDAKFKQHVGLESTSMIRSLAVADYNNDGLLDIFTCGYSKRHPDSIGLGRPIPYHDANNGAPNYLLHNQGGFRFSDVTNEVGLHENNSRFSYAAAWEDYDNDGDLDLYVANDFGRNNLYRNDGGNFKDVAAEAGVEDVAAGMSVTWGDFNRDGLQDIYVSNMFSSAGNRIAYQRKFRDDLDDETRSLFQRHARGNSLFQNMGDGTFRDVSVTAAVTEGRWAWGSNFADINNDGWQDLLVGNGMVTGTDDSGDL